MKEKKKKRKVDEFIIDVRPPLPGVKHTYTITSRRPTRCEDLRAGWPLRHRLATYSERSSLLPPRCSPPPQKKPHVEWKTIWKLKATMRGRMTVLQFLVILTVKSQIHHHSLLALPLSHIQWIWREVGRIQNGRGHCVRRQTQRSTACCSATSEILEFQKMGPLQHLHVALVDFKCGAESDRQTGQHVAALHEQKGLPIYFLTEGERGIYLPTWFCWTVSKYIRDICLFISLEVRRNKWAERDSQTAGRGSNRSAQVAVGAF